MLRKKLIVIRECGLTCEQEWKNPHELKYLFSNNIKYYLDYYIENDNEKYLFASYAFHGKRLISEIYPSTISAI